MEAKQNMFPNRLSPTPKEEGSRGNTAAIPSPVSSNGGISNSSNTPATPVKTENSPVVQRINTAPLAPPSRPGQPNNSNSGNTASSPTGPPRKRQRYDEPPIFARKASKSSSINPVNQGRPKPALPGATLLSQQHNPSPEPVPVPVPDQRPTVSQLPSKGEETPLEKEKRKEPQDKVTDRASQEKQVAPTSNNQEVRTSAPQGQAVMPPSAIGPPNETWRFLGPWEPTITNMIPYEELTRIVSDFIYSHVIMVDDPMLLGTGPGDAQLEIEAKLGQIVDRDSNERLRLPVVSETVLNMDDPSLRVQFKSSMTEVGFAHLVK